MNRIQSLEDELASLREQLGRMSELAQKLPDLEERLAALAGRPKDTPMPIPPFPKSLIQLGFRPPEREPELQDEDAA